VDPARIGQVLGNLLSNALRHTPSGGRVEVAVTPDGDAVRLQVTDNGDGIAEEHLQRIFERFYRVDAARDREHGGSGVGLAISRAIARAHGGELSAASAGPGKGTTITLSLPITEGSSEKLHTAP
jgi:signal transduction histidine kinase